MKIIKEGIHCDKREELMLLICSQICTILTLYLVSSASLFV